MKRQPHTIGSGVTLRTRAHWRHHKDQREWFHWDIRWRKFMLLMFGMPHDR